MALFKTCALHVICTSAIRVGTHIITHPQAKGQCEVTNRDIVHAIKARLGMKRNGWVDELPKVLWAHRTTHKNSTGETPFSLVYGSEAVIPVEITVLTKRLLSYSEEENDERLRTKLDYAKERWEMASIRKAANKQCVAKYYDKRIQARTYKVGDLEWRDNQASRAQNTGKLGPNWEGPYKVIGISNTGTYKLAELKGDPIKRGLGMLPRLKNATCNVGTRRIDHSPILS
ncbi:uncharacterized protein [Rutidosis leptorrhynchoides]|uniref:uncharacterized protein n=1 Tax=Rutidosis leptorrhynchoides TaxID=125765 RepID=UPI003A99EBBF